jgi:hypothetical protein
MIDSYLFVQCSQSKNVPVVQMLGVEPPRFVRVVFGRKCAVDTLGAIPIPYVSSHNSIKAHGYHNDLLVCPFLSAVPEYCSLCSSMALFYTVELLG